MPPSADAPMVRLPMAPGPVATTSGIRPAMKANDVIRMGRKRTFAPSMAASQHRRALLVLLHGELDDQHRVLPEQAHEHHQADLRVDVVGQAHAA